VDVLRLMSIDDLNKFKDMVKGKLHEIENYTEHTLSDWFEYDKWLEHSLAASYEILRRWEPAS